MKEAVIVSACRTPIASFQGSLARFRAPELGSLALTEALARAMRHYAGERDDSLALLREHLGADKGDPNDSYGACGPSLFTYPPYPDPRGIQAVLDFMATLEDRELARAGQHEAAEFIDTSILDALTARGAFEIPAQSAK